MKKILGLMIFVAMFSSCVSVPVSQQETYIERVLELVDNQDIACLMDISKSPFILDSEIVLKKGEIKMAWEMIFASGILFSDSHIVEIYPVTPEYYYLFGNSREVKLFFSKYIPTKKNGSIVELKTQRGRFLFLMGKKKYLDIDGNKKGFPEVIGFWGPVR